MRGTARIGPCFTPRGPMQLIPTATVAIYMMFLTPGTIFYFPSHMVRDGGEVSKDADNILVAYRTRILSM